MHPTDATIAGLLLALVLLALYCWHLKHDRDDQLRRASVANDKLKAARDRVSSLKATIEEQRICPGDCLNRRVEEFSHACGAFNAGTQGRREEKLNHRATENTEGETGNGSLTYEDLGAATRSFVELSRELGSNPGRDFRTVALRAEFEQQHGWMEALAPAPGNPSLRISWTPPGESEPLQGRFEQIETDDERFEVRGLFTPAEPVPDWFRHAWEQYKREQGGTQ